MDEWIDTRSFIHTMDYDSAIYRREAWTCATSWTIPENVMLSERSPSRQATDCVSPST